MSSLLSELKRRNVFRVAVAYIVVGWVVLQVAEFIAPLLQLPEWTVSLALYLGIIGFPFALIFAWAFELTHEGLKLTSQVDRDESITANTGKTLNRSIIALMAVAIMLLLAERFYSGLSGAGEAGLQATETAEATAPVARQGPKSIAVLPFDNMSDDPAQEYFSDGIAEELLNGLAKIQDLQVAARTSSFAFKGKYDDIKLIGSQLNVDTVLEGSVRKAGTRVRITAQLINVDDGYHIWSETYDRELDDIFAIQDEISRAIVAALKVHLTDGDIAGEHRPVDLAAYNFYLQGQHNLRRRTEQSLQLATRQYQRAIDIAADYADAWAGLAAATELLSEGNYGTQPIEESRQKAQEYLDRAFAINPELPRALAIQALLDQSHGNPHAALETIEKAIAANPSEGILYAWKSISLGELGRYRESREALEQAFRIDPLHQTIRHNLAMTMAQEGQHARAREMVTPDSELAYEVESAIANHEGRLADVFTALGRAIERAEGGYDRRLSDRQAAVLYFNLGQRGQGREQASAITLNFIDAFENPVAVVARLEAIPPDQRGHVNEDALALALVNLNRCEDVLEVYADRDYLDDDEPLWGNIVGGPSNIDDALLYGWCLLQLDRQEEAASLARRLWAYIDQGVANGAAPRYFDTLAGVKLLLGKDDEAMASLKHAWSRYDLGWLDMNSPLVAPLAGRGDFQALRAEVYAHLNAEREKLGWEPVELASLE